MIFAHSMGSLIGLGFALRQPEDLRGIALSGTAIHGERLAPAPLVSLLQLAARFIPANSPVPARTRRCADARPGQAARMA